MVKLFVFGSTGDLIKRKVFPALQKLDFKIDVYALGRRDFIDKEYHEFICEKNKCSKKFKENVKYYKINFEDNFICDYCLKDMSKKEINYFYISMPPKFIDPLLREMKKIKNHGFKIRVLIEKPFGEGLDHALFLKSMIKRYALEKEIFLSDHYLFKKGIYNFESKDYDYLRLVSIEEVGLEGRAGYYDQVGALKDMVQSHFFNILFKLTVDPTELEDLKDIKVVYGQYARGEKGKGYTEELGKKSKTITFVKLKFKTKSGKTIEFITGKGFKEKISYIDIDGKCIELGSDNSYVLLFKKFFEGDMNNFPTIDNAIKSWEILEEIPEKEIRYYKRGIDFNEFLQEIDNQ